MLLIIIINFGYYMAEDKGYNIKHERNYISIKIVIHNAKL